MAVTRRITSHKRDPLFYRLSFLSSSCAVHSRAHCSPLLECVNLHLVSCKCCINSPLKHLHRTQCLSIIFYFFFKDLSGSIFFPPLYLASACDPIDSRVEKEKEKATLLHFARLNLPLCLFFFLVSCNFMKYCVHTFDDVLHKPPLYSGHWWSLVHWTKMQS